MAKEKDARNGDHTKIDPNEFKDLPEYYTIRTSPTYENWSQPERISIMRDWAMSGADHEEIARRIGITSLELAEWRKRNQDMHKAIRLGESEANSLIVGSLFQKAREGNVQAIQYWLKHRIPDEWGDKKSTDEATAESIKLDNEIKRHKLEELESYKKDSVFGRYRGIPVDFIAPCFAQLHHDIARRKYAEYILPGGRGSTKSSFISLEIINLIENNPSFHACICRRVGDTLRDSVYTQIRWAIDKLGLSHDYKCTTSPLEIVKKSTEQHIYFRGTDDPLKIKSIKAPFGHIAVLWFEELDQFDGPESVRSVYQSVIRGGDEAYVFKSFNPPRSKINWANLFIQEPDPDNLRSITHSTYLDVPEEWLGKGFLQEAENQKQINPDGYDNEYMGVVNGHGGNVFENIIEREITDEEIAGFDRVVNGVDWGWYPDPFAFVRAQYHKAQSELIVFDELVTNKKSNAENAELIKRDHNVTEDDLIMCDSAEPKSISDFKNNGLYAFGVKKGPGSVEHGMKWLQSLKRIVIDKNRTPNVYREFSQYEYDRDPEGNVISKYPDENNHTIDSLRYAVEPLTRRMGEIKVGS